MSHFSIAPVAQDHQFSMNRSVRSYALSDRELEADIRSAVGPPQGGSRYNMARNPPYQVDFQAAASGKMVALTKRRLRWRFGFSNPAAIAKGQTGVDCRGEEHEVSVV
jgi:hypothetical protein